MSKTIVLFLFCGALILFGLLTAADLYRDIRLGGASLEWPTAEGEITYSVRRRSKSNLKSLEYSYAVAAFLRVPYVAPTHALYRTGQKVDVRFDPADPSRAVLEPGAPALAILAHAILPILLIGFGGAALFYGLRR